MDWEELIRTADNRGITRPEDGEYEVWEDFLVDYASRHTLMQVASLVSCDVLENMSLKECLEKGKLPPPRNM